MLAVSVFQRHEDDNGHHPEAVSGWDYYKTLYKVGTRFYEGFVRIENRANGREFKDITKIKEISRNAGQSAEAPADAEISINSISDSDEKSNKNLVLDEDYMQAARNGDEEKAAEYVEQAAKEWGAYCGKDGKPQVFYHGTPAKSFTVFKKDLIGSRFNFDEKGFFFHSLKSMADDYSQSEFDSKKQGTIFSTYLLTKKPFIFNKEYAIKNGYGNVFRDNDAIGIWDAYQGALLDEIEGKDYDSIIIDEGKYQMAVVFESNQIKSADPITYDDNGEIIPLSERFSESKDIRYSVKDTSSIKEQLKEKADILNNMPVVANVTTPKNFKNTKNAKEWALGILKSTGYKVDRENFGVIVFDEKRINRSLDYLTTDEEKAAFAALPRVLKRGKVIGKHENHKGRNFGTVTIAAPVKINGQRGNMAVIVMKTSNYFYKTHRIVLPNGAAFVFSENEETEPTPSRGYTENSAHAKTISSASEDRVAQNSDDVKKLVYDFSTDDRIKQQEDLSIFKASDVGWAILNSDNSTVIKVVNGLYDYYGKKGKSKKEAQKTIKTQVTKIVKEEYLKASDTQKGQIRVRMWKTGMYGSANEVKDYCDSWS